MGHLATLVAFPEDALATWDDDSLIEGYKALNVMSDSSDEDHDPNRVVGDVAPFFDNRTVRCAVTTIAERLLHDGFISTINAVAILKTMLR